MARLLIKTTSFAKATDASRINWITPEENLMKAFTTKEFISLAVIVVTAAVLALGVVLAAGATFAAGNDLLLMALTLCGAVVSGINGFGRRTARAKSPARSSRGGPQSSVALTS
jgi:hypothetical protein